MKETIYRFGPFELSSKERVLRREGSVVPLPPKAVSALLVLAAAGGRVVSKAELLEAVWPDSYVEEANLAQTISVLRKQLAGDFPDGSPVETIARVGYMFRASLLSVENLDVDEAPHGAASAREAETHGAESAQLKEPAAAPPVGLSPGAVGGPAEAVELAHGAGPRWWRLRASRRPAGSTRRTAWLLSARSAVFLLTLVVVIVALGLVVHARLRVRAMSRRQHPRIAVLAFSNLSGAPEAAWLSTALRELLSADLGSGAQLQVIAPETVERAERELKLARTDGLSAESRDHICNDLDCDELVTGSYLVEGGALRLNVHLYAVADHSQMGEFASTVPAAQLLALVAEADRSLRQSAGLPASTNSADLAGSSSPDPEAYRLYIEGLQKARAFDGRSASQLFQQSIALDPNFALSHLGLSSALIVLGEDQLAIEEAHKAQALAATLPREQQLQIEAQASQVEHQFDKAAAIYGTLLAFFPAKLDYARSQASMLDYAGHTAAAIAELKGVIDGATPEAHDPRFFSALADCYSTLGDWPSSLAWSQKGEAESQRRGATILYERLLTTDSQALYHMQQLPLALSRTEEALTLARQFEDYSGELRALNRIGQVETAMGRLPEAKAALEQALAREDELGEKERQIHTYAALGQNLAQAGKPAEALTAFEHGLTLARWYNEASFIVTAQLNVATAELRLGKVKQARGDLEEVVADANALGDRDTAGKAEKALAEIKP